MKIIKVLGLGVAMSFVALPVMAQDEEDPELYIYATYHYCDTDVQEIADEATANQAPVMDRLVDEGVISNWGWLAHHTGGQWRRINYFMKDSIAGLIDAQDAIGAAMDAEFGEDYDGPTVADGCKRHDDYIWQVESGTVGAARGDAAFSVYLMCDVSREERADELVESHVAPILDQFVEDGKLTSWGWSSHVVGGKYRRLQTMTAVDHQSLLAARGEAIAAIYGEDDEAGAELSDICGGHSDYMWNVVHETP